MMAALPSGRAAIPCGCRPVPANRRVGRAHDVRRSRAQCWYNRDQQISSKWKGWSPMAVVLVDPRRPSLIPVDAVDLLTGDVQYTEEMPVKVPWSLPAARPAYDGEDASVLPSSDPEHPAVKARLAAGDRLIAAAQTQAGERLVDAVAMMD